MKKPLLVYVEIPSDSVRCNHFNGLRSGKCRAGIEYETVAVIHDPIEYKFRGGDGATSRSSRSIPCISSSNLVGCKCPKQNPKNIGSSKDLEMRWQMFLSMQTNEELIDGTPV